MVAMMPLVLTQPLTQPLYCVQMTQMMLMMMPTQMMSPMMPMMMTKKVKIVEKLGFPVGTKVGLSVKGNLFLGKTTFVFLGLGGQKGPGQQGPHTCSQRVERGEQVVVEGLCSCLCLGLFPGVAHMCH